MKKFLKFLASLVAIVSVIGGAYYVVKNFILKDDDDDFDEFDDDFDDFDDDTPSDNRGYVTLNPDEPEADTEQEKADTNEADENAEADTTDEKEENDFIIEE